VNVRNSHTTKLPGTCGNRAARSITCI